MTLMLTAFLRPFVACAVLALCRPLVAFAWRSMPEGIMKRILFISWKV